VFGASGWALYSVLLKRWRSLLPFAVRFVAIVLAGVAGDAAVLLV
jgi:hypothetical protein